MPNLLKIRNSKFEIRNWQSNKGFTLIELLVVIAIIGILATFIVASFSSAQQRGRDARRKADLDAVKKALELAKNDCTGAKWYPLSAGPTAWERYSGPGNSLENFLDNSSNLNYIRSLPHDPTRYSGALTELDYQYTPNGTPSTSLVCRTSNTLINLNGQPGFVLSALLENVNDPSAAASLAKCSGLPAVPRATIPAGSAGYYVCSD